MERMQYFYFIASQQKGYKTKESLHGNRIASFNNFFIGLPKHCILRYSYTVVLYSTLRNTVYDTPQNICCLR